MSAYITLDITRSRAKMALMDHILGEITGDDLKRFMDALLEPRLYKCDIVPDDQPNNDDVLD